MKAIDKKNFQTELESVFNAMQSGLNEIESKYGVSIAAVVTRHHAEVKDGVATHNHDIDVNITDFGGNEVVLTDDAYDC